MQICLASEVHEDGIVDGDYGFLPSDWMNNSYWQDESHCVTAQNTDSYLTFNVIQDPDNVMATRDGCQQWFEL